VWMNGQSTPKMRCDTMEWLFPYSRTQSANHPTRVFVSFSVDWGFLFWGFLFVCFCGTGFELRASHMLGKGSITWAMCPVLFTFSLFFR
jgi:hypothetical protein